MLSKIRENTKLLGKKTRRKLAASKDIIEIEEDKTTINLIYLNDKNINNKNYTYIKFSFSNKISLDNLIKNKEQTISLYIESNEILIVDKIELGNDKINIKQNFLLPIYIKKVNTCYISLKPKNKGYFFELIFYAKAMKNLPRNLICSNEQELQTFDNYGLKYRKKINVINVEKNLFNYYIKNIEKLSLDSNSYKICSLIKSNVEITSSLHELKLEKKVKIKKNLIKPDLTHIKKIQNLFEEFKKYKKLENIRQKYKALNNDNAFKQFIKQYTYVHALYSEIPEINDEEVYLLKEYILKFILKYLFINTNEMNEPKEQIITKQLEMIDNIIKIINDIEKFTKDKKHSKMLKYRLYRATLYNLYSVTKKDSKNDYFCLSILAEYKQKIININQNSKNNPYYKAITFLKEVASKLDEKSCLFHLLMQYNSGISDDITLLGENNKGNAEDTKYEISLLTVDEIKNHLKDILPDFIIRYTCNNDKNAFYSSLNDLIFINEKKTFDNISILNLDNNNSYTLPIVLLLIHECWGHMKVIKSNKIKRKSSIKNYLRNKNFNEELIEIIEKNTGKVKGESGLELENLITGSKDKFFSEFLLSKYEIINKNLLNSDLWVKTSFKDFQNLMRANIKKSMDQNISKIILSKNREKEDDNDLSKYCLQTYYEDDVEIGPLYIV